MIAGYEAWLNDVRSALRSINMPIDDWQTAWRFDFEQEFKAGTEPSMAAEKANRYWWHQQNKAVNQHCRRSAQCWLPQNHQGECQPI